MNRMVRPGAFGGTPVVAGPSVIGPGVIGSGVIGPIAAGPPARLAGSVERVTFHNAETGFCVLGVHVPRGAGPRAGFGRRDRLVPVVGHAPAVGVGEWIEAVGAWVQDPGHGPQFRAASPRVAPPTGAEGLARYLACGGVPGVGPVTARRLLAAFGEGVLTVIEMQPERLAEVAGIGPARAVRIAGALAEARAVREVAAFLEAHGLGAGRAVRVYRTYGRDAVAVMRADPYRLMRDVPGIGA